MEEFKEIPNFKYYQVTDNGIVRSFKTGKWKIMTGGIDTGGYRYVNMCRNDGVRKNRSIHQLVAEVFLGHIPCGMEIVVNHIDFNIKNNCVSNLELVINRENTNRKHLKYRATSKFTGVSLTIDKKWLASINVKGKQTYIGRFDTEEEASQWYNNAVESVKNGLEIKVSHKTFSSKYVGVSKTIRYGKVMWQAKIRRNYKDKGLGVFINEIDAHNAYQNALANLHLIFPNLI